MREPMNWALTLFRLGGVPVRVHLVFFLFALGLVLRQVHPARGPSGRSKSSCSRYL